MKNNDFIALLNDLYEKELSFRDIKKVRGKNGDSYSVGSELFRCDYDIVVCILLRLYYKKIIVLHDNFCIDEVEQCIRSSAIPQKEDLLKIWMENKNEYPYFQKFVELLSKYDFSSFTTNEDYDTLIDWVNEKYLLRLFLFGLDDNATVALEVIAQCQKQLGIDLDKGSILVGYGMVDPEIIKAILSKHKHRCRYTFYGLHDALSEAIRVNKALFECYSDIIILDKEGEGSLVPSTGSYDGVIVQSDATVSQKLILGDKSILDVVNDNGFAIVNNIDNKKSFGKCFIDYEVPLMFDNGLSNTLLIKKTKDESSVVRYGKFYCNDIADRYDWPPKLTECIKNSITTEYYQELKKEDFANTGQVCFDKVKRRPDQLNFIWKKKEELFTFVEDEEDWLYNTSVGYDQIIDENKLSKDPFNIAVDPSAYLQNFVNEGDGKEHILKECKIERKNDYKYEYSLPDKYWELYSYLYDHREDEDKTEAFDRLDKKLCCRIVKSPCLLYNGWYDSILRINATATNPVCIKKYSFKDSPDMGIYCQPVCDVIRINPDYDENFIVYQLLKEGLFRQNILVAPTKEEQHTYFLNKRLDYLSPFQQAEDEMDAEVNKSISDSPTHVTGVGFNNFRRFASLPILPFSGVNVLVGANNAGKSSLVKGMLLAIDNLKSYIVDNSDNTLLNPMFHFDTRNYHDVRVGTFDRSYSYNSMSLNGKKGDRTMSFLLSCAHFTIELDVEPHVGQNDQSAVPVSSMKIRDNKRNAEFGFDFRNLQTTARFEIEGECVEYKYPGINISRQRIGENQLPVMIRSIIYSTDSSFLQDKGLSKKLKAKAGFILEIADELERVIKKIDVEYIYAHGVSQKVLFNMNDKNDYMAQTLHDFVLEKIGDVEDEFIKKYLINFGLGIDYDVHSIGGEAYIIQIKNQNGRMVYLADLGMGTNQLIILIFRLAIIIHKQRMLGATPYKPTIIIEEPEQNMHPAFQSKLATLFYEVNRDYDFSFIVETHSEYLVRKTQVIVAQQKYADDQELQEKNPFMVYYFPSEGMPYSMVYRTDGNFSNEFGAGFYDEASSLLFEIL